MSLDGQIRRLEKLYDEAIDRGDEEEAEALGEDLRELDREAADQDRWREEGQERGWY